MSNRMADAIIGTIAIAAGVAAFIVLVLAVIGNDAGAAVEIGLLK